MEDNKLSFGCAYVNNEPYLLIAPMDNDKYGNWFKLDTNSDLTEVKKELEKIVESCDGYFFKIVLVHDGIETKGKEK